MPEPDKQLMLSVSSVRDTPTVTPCRPLVWCQLLSERRILLFFCHVKLPHRVRASVHLLSTPIPSPTVGLHNASDLQLAGAASGECQWQVWQSSPQTTSRAPSRRPRFSPGRAVYSEILGATIFFCADEDTKAALMGRFTFEHLYPSTRCTVLVAQNRAKAFLPDELCHLHEIKRTFQREDHQMT